MEIPTPLYHFTAPTTSHLGAILAEKKIDTTESNISAYVAHAGPDVVWLTDTMDRNAQKWSQAGGGDRLKLQSVLLVEPPADQLCHWPAWAREQGIDESTYEGLAKSGGDPEQWWVSTEPIYHTHITGLLLLPCKRPDGVVQDFQQFSGHELSRLFRSAKARDQLNLMPTGKMQALDDGGQQQITPPPR